MWSTLRNRALLGTTIVTALIVGACSTTPDKVAAPKAMDAFQGTLANNTNENQGFIDLCKDSGPTGTYTFDFSVNGGGGYFFNWGPSTTLDFAGTVVCKHIYTTVHGDWATDQTAAVTITEDLPANIAVSEIAVFDAAFAHINGGYRYSVYNTNTITVTVTEFQRLKVHYHNIEVPPPTVNCYEITAVQGVAITPVQVTGSGGTGGPYTFEANGLPDGLVMSSDGTISGTPTVTGTFSYIVIVTDKDGHTGTSGTCGVKVNPPPVIANCVEVTAVKGVPLTPVQLTASGGNGGPYTFTATGLPGGLSLSSDGVLSGIPTETGTFSYTVTVTDSDGNTGTSSGCNIVVNPPPKVEANCVEITAVKGVPITPTQLTASGGIGGPYTFSASGLPAGLSLSSSGVLSGTPTVTGTFSYTVTVTDAGGNTGTSAGCNVVVNPPPRVVVNCTQITAVQGVPITPTQLVASGGLGGPYTFSASGLPAGLSLSSSGVLSGTPTVSGTFSYSVTATDVAGNTGTSGTCGVTIKPPPPQFCSYTPGGWGAEPNGNNVGSILHANFTAVYGSGGVRIGVTGVSGRYSALWKTAQDVTNFLPNGSTPGVLVRNLTNPLSTEAGEFASQVLALRFNVNFSAAGKIKPGFNTTVVVSGPLAGLTTTQVLALAQQAISGSTGVLAPYGITVAQMTKLLSYINGNYDNCTSNNGYLQ